MNQRELQQHVIILGWLHIVSNVMLLLLGCFVLVLLAGIGMITDDPIAMTVLGLSGLFGGLFMAVLAVPGIVAGAGLLRRRGWGRILALIMGVLGLVNFPIGTAIGIYTFWVLLQNAATEYFAPSPSSD